MKLNAIFILKQSQEKCLAWKTNFHFAFLDFKVRIINLWFMIYELNFNFLDQTLFKNLKNYKLWFYSWHINTLYVIYVFHSWQYHHNIKTRHKHMCFIINLLLAVPYFFTIFNIFSLNHGALTYLAWLERNERN